MWPHRCHLQGNLQLPRAGSARNPEVGGLANSPRFRPVNRLESVSVCITTPHAYFADQQLLTSTRDDVELSAREVHIHVEYSIPKLHEALAHTGFG